MASRRTWGLLFAVSLVLLSPLCTSCSDLFDAESSCTEIGESVKLYEKKNLHLC